MTEFSPSPVTRAIGARRPTVAVVGVGAIGTAVADSLSSYADVTLCRRGSTSPMSIDVDGDLHRVHATVVGHPGDASPVDWVVVTVKAQDTRAIGPWLDALVGPHTTVVVLQNGIGHAERVSEWVPASRVLAGIVYIAAEKVAPDLVVCRDLGALALEAGTSASGFAALFDSRLSIRIVDDFVTESWTKLVMNSALNTVTALTDRTMEVTDDLGVRPLLRSLLAEGVLVAEAEGARFANDAAESFLLRMDGLPRNSATSMLLDRRAGRPLEHNYLTGAVLTSAELHGVSVPTLRLIHGLIDALDGRAALALAARTAEAEAHAETEALEADELAA